MTRPTHILRVDAGVRHDQSVSRELADAFLASLPSHELIRRDLADGIPLLDATWVGANLTDEAERTPEQTAALELSEQLIGELEAADAIVLSVPMYNFGPPAAFKAWIDQVARARRTFRYTPNGPEGLLEDRPVFVFVATGGTPAGSDIDFLTGYLRHVLAFLGLTDVTIIPADRLMADRETALERARAEATAAAETLRDRHAAQQVAA